MKKQYMNPSIQVLMIQPSKMLCQSRGGKSLNNNEGFTMPDGGTLNDDDDDV